MYKQEFLIDTIPSVLWGEASGKLFIAVHGNMSHKEDEVIAIFADAAVARGYQVLSFDLPEHGGRKSEPYACTVQNCVHDLKIIMNYAKGISADISLFACSMGAYFSLVTYGGEALGQCLFLSPVLDMERLIRNMMAWNGVTEEKLEFEKDIPIPDGPALSWDYFSYVKAHPIVKWDKKTCILYGSKDNLTESDVVTAFCSKFGCKLTVLENGEHFFYYEEQLSFYRKWLTENLDY